jgi:glycosyltransferase involved in cell wall biosynthesis/predicted Zn-dependent protease
MLMPRRYLFGPVSATFADQHLHSLRQAGQCRTFGPEGTDLVIQPRDTWERLCSRLPPDWRPDFVALYLPYTLIPPCLWTAPVPLVGLAADWNLNWHTYRRCLRYCDLILTDTPGVEVLVRAGLGYGRVGNLFGLERGFLEEPIGEGPRDIDILFVGNVQPAVQRERLPWLARLARLGERWRVAIQTNIHGPDYRALLRRARIVFNRSIRGECNRRAFEAASQGALLFQEADNREVAAYLRDRQECVYYTAANLEALLEHYLTHEEERQALADAAHGRVAAYGFAALWKQALQCLEEEWPDLVERARVRPHCSLRDELHVRTRQVIGGGSDPALVPDLATALVAEPYAATLHHNLGLALTLEGSAPSAPALQAEIALGYFQRAVACDPNHVLASLDVAEALAARGKAQGATDQAKHTLALVDRLDEFAPEVLDAGHFPVCFDPFRVEWERAAWLHAGDAAAEVQAKRALLRWRLHTLLAELTGEVAHCYEAAVARPDLPASAAALGMALFAANHPAEALPYLRQAVAAQPFDGVAARTLFDVLGALGDVAGQRRLARDRRLLAQAAPQLVPAEPWFVETPPVGDELASLIILCCNQVEFTRMCLENVLCHTRPPYELVLVDNGSTDATPAYLEELRQRSGPERVVVLRNETNCGFAAGCNQGLAQARGRYLVLLNNDTLVTGGWLEGLIGWALHDWPKVGMVGPMTNYAAPPQEIPVDYRTPEELALFATRRRQEFAGQALHVERLLGFCMLLRREVVERLGGLDERFGLGFFEDDDLCVRVREAGFQLVMVQEVFLHHFGSRTFAGLGIDCHKQLRENYELFRDKWGPERAAGYRLPEPPPPLVGPPPLPAEAASTATVSEPVPAEIAGGGRVRISFCMIAKNEEANLPACLGSVADLVDEMIVVDTGSTDRTREAAVAAGARVIDFAWCDSFAAARNESLGHATGDWIFWLDGDERLDETNRQRLRELFAGLGRDNVAYLMEQRSPLEESTHGTTRVHQVRLFRNHPAIRWEYRVHEQILLAVRRTGGDLRPTGIVIDHVGFIEPAVQGPKVERNLRLLRLELAERPNDPFVLYNLGAVALTQGQTEEALRFLRRSLEHSQPGDTLVRKLYALLARGHQQLGQQDEALTVCRGGLARYPDDAELLFWESVLLEERGDLAGAEACLLKVLRAPAGEHLTGVDAGLQGFRARHNLASLYRRQGRLPEAVAQWRAAVAECPGFPPAWQNLAELALEQGRWAELDEAAACLQDDPQTAMLSLVLRGRGQLAQRRFAAARQLLEEAVQRAPQALEPRLYLSHVLLQEGTDWEAAEQALHDVLTLDPGNSQAAHNLQVLRLRQGKPAEPAPDVVVPAAVVSAPPGGARVRVSLCMIVKNEEENLPACLGCVADLVDEIIIVDTGSTDRTNEIAARFGARVFDFPWVDSFAAARNESLRHATGEYIFWMDADDRLDEDNRARLRQLLAGLRDENAAYVMQCLCLPDPVSQRATRVTHLRLFRNHPDIRWQFRVHEQILPAVRQSGGTVYWTEIVIHHTGYQDPALRGRKLERDLRLLRLEEAEAPENPFTLFNLGCLFQEQGRLEEALSCFQRSLAKSAPSDSIVRKLYASIAQVQRHRGQKQEALATCQEGRRLYPDDVELLFQEGVVRRELNDRAGALACYERLLATPPGQYFASVDTGLSGYLARCNLAELYRAEGREAGAETQWRAALAERPDFRPAWLELGDLLIRQGRWREVEDVLARLRSDPEGAEDAAVLQARGHLARQEFSAARKVLEEANASTSPSLEPLLALSYALLQEGTDWDAAEKVLQAILAREPGRVATRRNLALLLERRGRKEEAAQVDEETLALLYRAACETPSDINEHCPTLCALAKECRHVTEMGTRAGVSTTALLYARPEVLVCYDRVKHPEVDLLTALAGRTRLVFHQADVLQVVIEETDLLFLDTWHVFEQVQEELRLHGPKARKYIVLHDTATFGEQGETAGHRGLWPAVEEFLVQGKFKVRERFVNNNGLTVLERVGRLSE